jgi:hypothetical protein
MSKIFYEEGNPLHVRANLKADGNFNIGGATRGEDDLGEKIIMRLLAFNHFKGVMFPTLNEGQSLDDKNQEKFEVYYLNPDGLVCCILVAGSYAPSEFRQSVLRPRLNMATGELTKFHEMTVTARLVPKEKGVQKFSVVRFDVVIAEPEEVKQRAAFLETARLFSYELTAEKLRFSDYYNFSRSVNTYDPLASGFPQISSSETTLSLPE